MQLQATPRLRAKGAPPKEELAKLGLGALHGDVPAAAGLAAAPQAKGD